jgi:RHS repeat-associated protein
VEGVRRHDYLPFGEENVYNAVGGSRTAANGYVADGVRQQFVGYERDNETGLDFAQARYYSNVQGRFTSVDPLLSSGNPVRPQSWNRYAYSFNNPLRFTDPTGLFVIDPNLTEEQREDILRGYNALKGSLQNQSLSKNDRKRIEKALKILGNPGVDNGINVTIGAIAGGNAETDPRTNNVGNNRSRTNPL